VSARPSGASEESQTTKRSGAGWLQDQTEKSTVFHQGQYVNEPGGLLARRRHQRGSLFTRVIKAENGTVVRTVWVGRWREDEISNGRLRRVRRSEVLGDKKEGDLPTRSLAKRRLEERLALVNDPMYRARPSSTFAEFAKRWETLVLIQHKPSTQANLCSHLRRYIVPFFGPLPVRDVRPDTVQCFISGIKANPKTVRNIFVTLQMMWKSARAWQYVAHDALDGVVLPKRRTPRRFFFSQEEVSRILCAADEPFRTFYWLAAELGLRAGEICGLRLDDLDLEACQVHVRQSAWRGKLQEPKTASATRTFAVSQNLIEHLQRFILRWRSNPSRLLFASRNGTPFDQNLLVKRKLHPLLEKLNIPRCGLHAFRHFSASMMDRLNTPLKLRQQRLGHTDAEMTLGVYSHVAREDDLRIAAQLGEILDPSGPLQKGKGVAVSQQPLVN
jgi:integrase